MVLYHWLLNCFIIFLILGINQGQEIDESKNERTQSETVGTGSSEADSPKDVKSVSKFIEDFHKKYIHSLYDKAAPSSIVASGLGMSASPEAIRIVGNGTEVTSTNSSSSFINCSSERQPGVLSVELVNSTRLLSLLTADSNVTSKTTEANCVVLLFYARTCPFSCMAAPHFNALPRAFPAIKMVAVNVIAYQNFNTQYGIVGVPTVMLFHNGRPAAKFNDSEYTLEMFTRFLTKYTGLAPEEKMFVTSADFGGPVPSVVAKETDYWLYLAWTVIILFSGLVIGRSRAWEKIVEAIQNTWRETEAQHPHAD